MSQEQPPLRSRRELRQARSEAAPESGLTPRQQQAPPPRPDRTRRASSGPFDSVPERGRERSSQVRARDRAALRAAKEQTDREGPEQGSEPPTRRQMRLRQLQEQSPTASVPIVPAPDQGAAQGAMTVEQALAARSEIAEQARNHLAKLAQSANAGPDVVDPQILKEQMALAEKAAAINRRGAGQQRPATPNAPQPQSAGPAVTNPGMAAPLDFIRKPAAVRPVKKTPATSSVPVVTQSQPKVKPSDVSLESSSGRSWVIARAEAAARAADSSAAQAPAAAREDHEQHAAARFFEEQAPIAASSAYGLEPLDAATAGLARAQRSRYLQYGVLALGVLALVSGLILIISGMTR